MKKKYTIKQLLISNQNWWSFYQKHIGTLRIAIVVCIVKLLSCKNSIRGYTQFDCSNPNCSHTKRVPFTCKSRACSSCGKMATEKWIQKQNNVLPKTNWQHITFTMPSELWDFFWLNRHLLNYIAKDAAQCIQTLADKKNVIPGLFVALHTFGRNLKRNVHLHLSTTLGGLSKDLTCWKKLFFKQSVLMKMWRYRIIARFRIAYQQHNLIIPESIKAQLNQNFTFNDFLDQLYQKTWIVHCSKPQNNPKINVNYLGRYIKRPPIAESKLAHYDGCNVTFDYLDHTTKTYRKFKLTIEQFIGRLVQHIPDIGFRLIRYYGFLAHRLRGKYLNIVYDLLQQEKSETQTAIHFAGLLMKSFNLDPFQCILCGQKMILSRSAFGINNANQLLAFHRALATLKKC